MKESLDDDGEPNATEGGEEKVGYKRPPKAHQFKKGRSGNPRGRKKGSKSFETLVREELGKTIQIKADGKLKSLSVGQALLMRTLREAVGGSRRAADQGLRLMERYGLEAETAEIQYDFSGFTAAELDEWARLLHKSMGQEKEWLQERARQKAEFQAERVRIFGPGVLDIDPDVDGD